MQIVVFVFGANRLRQLFCMNEKKAQTAFGATFMSEAFG